MVGRQVLSRRFSALWRSPLSTFVIRGMRLSRSRAGFLRPEEHNSSHPLLPLISLLSRAEGSSMMSSTGYETPPRILRFTGRYSKQKIRSARS